MSTDSYSQYRTYEDPDYFKDRYEAAEKMEEWWLNRIRGILEEQIELTRGNNEPEGSKS